MSKLEPQTKWELMTYDELVEIAADDDVVVNGLDDLMNYLSGRNDIQIVYLGNDRFDVLFA